MATLCTSHRATALALLASFAAASEDAPPQYNVLFLSSDSMDGRLLDPTTRYQTLVEMPALRSLAASGANFAMAYSHSPVCGPSRASIVTSRYVHETGVWNNYQEIVPAPSPTGVDDTCVTLYGLAQCRLWAAQYPVNYTLFDAFTEAGYDMSGIFGKLDFGANSPQRWPSSDPDDDHTGPELRNVPRGADILLDSMGRATSNPNGGANLQPHDESVITKAIAWLEAKPFGSTPFFLYAGLSVPHFPFVTNATWLARVNRSAITLPPWKPIDKMHPYDRHMTTSKGCAYDFTDAEILQLRAVYLAMAAEADDMHGRLLAALAASPHANNTIVIFWSDHGEMAFEARQVLPGVHSLYVQVEPRRPSNHAPVPPTTTSTGLQGHPPRPELARAAHLCRARHSTGPDLQTARLPAGRLADSRRPRGAPCCAERSRTLTRAPALGIRWRRCAGPRWGRAPSRDRRL